MSYNASIFLIVRTTLELQNDDVSRSPNETILVIQYTLIALLIVILTITASVIYFNDTNTTDAHSPCSIHLAAIGTLFSPHNDNSAFSYSNLNASAVDAMHQTPVELQQTNTPKIIAMNSVSSGFWDKLRIQKKKYDIVHDKMDNPQFNRSTNESDDSDHELLQDDLDDATLVLCDIVTDETDLCLNGELSIVRNESNHTIEILESSLDSLDGAVTNDTIATYDATTKLQTLVHNDECIAIQRVISALDYYEVTMDCTQNDGELTKACNTIYKSLLDDWIHIMTEHSNDPKMVSYRKPHNILNCSIANRHYFNAIVYDINDNKDTDFIFYRHLLDSIHCYIHHLEDVGLRVSHEDIHKDDTDLELADICNIQRKKTQILLDRGLQMQQKEDKYDLSHHIQLAEASTHDTLMDRVYKFMSKHLTNNGPNRSFCALLLDQEYDSESIKCDFEDVSQSNLTQYNASCSDVMQQYLYKEKLHHYTFSIGYRFYYYHWLQFKSQIAPETEGTEPSMMISHPNDLQSHPIKAKYRSLKDEILNFSRSVWDSSLLKTYKYMETFAVKQMKCIVDEFGYGLKKDDEITKLHLLSIVLYCDHTELQTQLTQTFRKNELYESIASVIARHREYAIWSRLLRETVEIFGVDGSYSCGSHGDTIFPGRGPFYCGMSKEVVMPQFDVCLFGPTSTSKCVEIATRFGGDDGIVIQLNNNGNNDNIRLKSFSCSWISCHRGEEEWLFCGSKYKLKIDTVIIMRNQHNFSQFFSALFYFDCMLSGSKMDFGGFNIKSVECKEEYHSILSNLIHDQLEVNGFENNSPKYINSTFKAYTLHKTEIILNIHQIKTYFTFFSDLIFYSVSEQQSYDRSVEFYRNIIKSTFLNIFSNLKEIIVQSSAIDSETGNVLQYKFNYSSLLKILSESKQLFTINDLSFTIKAIHEYRCSSENLKTWKIIESRFENEGLCIEKNTKELKEVDRRLNEDSVSISKL